MKLHLSDLDELIQKVRNTHPKNYLNEAIVSYRAGAYRAAVITTWIAVCVDIIEKIRELSISGDQAAKAIAERLDKINPRDPAAMMSFERDLLDIACDQLEFLSVIEKSHLERLKEDRNICAHPTFASDGGQFTPLAEVALSYIVQSANYLLIHQPVKGKVAIDRLFQLISEESFPEDDEKAFVVLSSENNLGRVRESTIKNLVVVLLKRLFRDEDGISQSLFIRIVSALGAIARINPEIYKEVLSSKLSKFLTEASDKQLKRAFPFLHRRSEEWGRIDEAVKVRVERLLSVMSVDDLISYQVLQLAEKVPKIFSATENRVEELAMRDKIKLLSSMAYPSFKKHAITLFVSSMSFDAAVQNGQCIVLPLVKNLNGDDVKIILTGSCENVGAYGNNQILPAGGIESFFLKLYQGTKSANPTHNDSWLMFRGKAKERNISYEKLDAAMVEDGLIAAPAEELAVFEGWDDDIPF